VEKRQSVVLLAVRPETVGYSSWLSQSVQLGTGTLVLVVWPLLTLLSVVVRVPVGFDWQFEARASASPQTMPAEGPSTTDSDGAEVRGYLGTWPPTDGYMALVPLRDRTYLRTSLGTPPSTRT